MNRSGLSDLTSLQINPKPNQIITDFEEFKAGYKLMQLKLDGDTLLSRFFLVITGSLKLLTLEMQVRLRSAR
ncbi:hypothetical protein BDD43_2163 [Mucilaginibacter gracilis]|uniref:Uncharacterized protein n=1 Tax=Mucilaginibacter gracilis TaxID=423350 RepID=A0A495J1N6_9SPHI|nr:hypothetical protein [Mucilaginibacter gracilis]RKR81999.1 hypothetical protein BDD43_2163 [Mucilaginibacter gracilis]